MRFQFKTPIEKRQILQLFKKVKLSCIYKNVMTVSGFQVSGFAQVYRKINLNSS